MRPATLYYHGVWRHAGIPARVGSVWSVAGSAGVASAALPAHTVSVNNFIVICMQARAATAPTGITPTDTLGLTWTQQAPTTNSAGNLRTEVWTAPIRPATGGGSTTITVTPSASSTIAAVAAEFSGVNWNGPYDGGKVGTSAASSSLSTGSATVGGTGELLVAAIGQNGAPAFSAQLFSPNNTTTAETTVSATGANNHALQMIWEVLALGGAAASPSFTATSTTTTSWNAMWIALKHN